MHNSIAIELTKLFRDMFRKQAYLTETWKDDTIRNMVVLLGKHDQDEIRNHMISFKKNNPHATPFHLYEVFPELVTPTKPTKSKGQNLIKPGAFCYHNELRKMPPPPRCIQKDDGTYEWIIEKFYLEIKDFYSLDELMKYFNTKMRRKSLDIQRDLGALRFMVNKYGLDTVLYAIDASYDHATEYESRLPNSPIDLGNYMSLGIDRLELKKAEAREYGTNKVVPRSL